MKRVTLPYVDRGPMRPTRPWKALAERYRWTPAFEPMAVLIEHVAAAPYADRLFGYTSMHTLVIAQTAEVYATQEVVRVEYSDETFLITCQERGLMEDVPENDPIARRVPIDQAIAAFERLLRAKRWA